jgi:hypothetical protein
VTPSLDELIPLLYRARWYDLSLSARIFQRTLKPQERLHSNVRDSEDHSEYRGLIRLGPGGRYRVDLIDQDGDEYAAGCDGQASWEMVDGIARSLSRVESIAIPFKNLLEPNWLIARFAVDVIGTVTVGDRPAYSIKAIPRQGAYRRVGPRHDFTEVNALIDARLGIILRCETLDGRGARRVSELSDLQEGPSVVEAAEIFVLPAGIARSETGILGPSPGPQAQSDQLTPSVTAEEINLIYRSDLIQAEFSAVLSEQSNPSLMIKAASETLGSSTVPAFRILNSSWMRKSLAKRVPSSSHRIAAVQVSMPERCRIDFRDQTPGGIRSIVYDGHQTTRSYRGRTGFRASKSFPVGMGLIVDPAWLLDGYKLSENGPETFSGRDSVHFSAAAENVTGEILTGPLAGQDVPVDKVELTIDRELGITLRLAAYFQGQPALLCELSEIVPYVRADAFRLDLKSGDLRTVIIAALADPDRGWDAVVVG